MRKLSTTLCANQAELSTSYPQLCQKRNISVAHSSYDGLGVKVLYTYRGYIFENVCQWVTKLGMHKNIYGKAHGCHVVTNAHVINITITFFGKNAHFLRNADRAKMKECDNHAELRNLRKGLDKQKILL